MEGYSERERRIVNRMVDCLHYSRILLLFWRILGILCFSPAHGEHTLDLDGWFEELSFFRSITLTCFHSVLTFR